MSFLKIKNLSVDYPMRKETIYAAKGVNIEVNKGEILGLVGESGSGKSSVCRLVLKLINKTSGSISWFKKDIDSFNSSELKNFRKSVQVIFQDPYGSLDPRMTIGKIISEPLDIYRKNLKIEEKEELVITAMKDVGLSHFSGLTIL